MSTKKKLTYRTFAVANDQLKKNPVWEMKTVEGAVYPEVSEGRGESGEDRCCKRARAFSPMC